MEETLISVSIPLKIRPEHPRVWSVCWPVNALDPYVFSGVIEATILDAGISLCRDAEVRWDMQ